MAPTLLDETCCAHVTPLAGNDDNGDAMNKLKSPCGQSACSTEPPSPQLSVSTMSPNTSHADSIDLSELFEQAFDVMPESPCMGSKTANRNPSPNRDRLVCAFSILMLCLLLAVIWAAVVYFMMMMWSLIQHFMWLPIVYWVVVFLITPVCLLSNIGTTSRVRSLLSPEAMAAGKGRP